MKGTALGNLAHSPLSFLGQKMSDFKDIQGYLLHPGDHVGVAFSISGSSYAKIRVGRIISLEPHFVVHWDKGEKDSQPMRFYEDRIVRL